MEYNHLEQNLSDDENKFIKRPPHSLYSFISENVNYWWNPAKLLKNEIMSGEMTADRIKYLIEQNVNKIDATGRLKIDEEVLKHIYTYNKKTIDRDGQLKIYITMLIKEYRREKINSDKLYEINDKSGCLEEMVINHDSISWLK